EDRRRGGLRPLIGNGSADLIPKVDVVGRARLQTVLAGPRDDRRLVVEQSRGGRIGARIPREQRRRLTADAIRGNGVAGKGPPRRGVDEANGLTGRTERLREVARA